MTREQDRQQAHERDSHVVWSITWILKSIKPSGPGGYFCQFHLLPGHECIDKSSRSSAIISSDIVIQLHILSLHRI